jgi:peroxiredoxin Q/BCP
MDVGDPFPDFALPDENGEIFDSSSLRGIRYVIYFYPKDGTPGCTREAIGFNGRYVKFMMMNIPIIGVSKDSPESHRRFREKNGLKMKLLSDADAGLMKRAGVWGLKKNYGKEYEGTIRSTFIVGKDGMIEAVWSNVKIDGHAYAVDDRLHDIIADIMETVV